MRILMYRWKAYNYWDIEETFLLLGHQVDNIEQKLGSYDIDEAFEKVLKERLETTSYDMVFTVNYFAVISNICQKLGIKYVSWTCDNPLISMYHESVFHPCNYIFTFDKTNYLEFKGMGVEHIWYLPLAVDTKRLDNLLDGDGFAASVLSAGEWCRETEGEGWSDKRIYAGDVAFVGSLYERNSYDKLKSRLSPYLQGYFDAVMEAQLNISGANIVESMLTTDILEQLQEYFKMEKSEGSFSDIGLIFQTTVLGFKIAEVQRRRALIELSKRFKVNVYSNSDVSDLERVQYMGSVDYWSELPKVFRESKINLNFTIPNIKSGIPLRVWDILGARGFLLTNYQAELPLYFKEGEDLVCFDGIEDMKDKIAYYLANEVERREIAWNGYEKVKKYHSYVNRIQEMLRIISEEES